MEQEDRRQSSPTGVQLCRAGCGFFGAPATDGLCSKCYGQTAGGNDAGTSAGGRAASSVSLHTAASACDTQSLSCATASSASLGAELTQCPSSRVEPTQAEAVVAGGAARPRCAQCNRRVGLTGITCRCGGLYCTEHRYSDAHGCTFDYRALGAAEVAKNNPLVVADKVDKI